MSTATHLPAAEEWVSLILNASDPAETWSAIFSWLRDLALTNPGAAALHRETITPDRLLSETAWSLWEDFPRCAQTVVDELKGFWTNMPSTGTAVLVLDGLSLRELPLIVQGGERRGITPRRVEVRGAEVPTETNRFAEALGLPGRAKLYNNQASASFIFSGPDVYTDLVDSPFADCVGSIPAAPRLFIWHKWPDEPLIHLHEDKKEGPTTVAAQTKAELGSDGFWALVERLRQGRYATSGDFSSEVKDEKIIKLLRTVFGAKRCAPEDPSSPWPQTHLPPLVCRHDGWLVVIGQHKWAVQGGFPHLCHRGLSLLEAAVPFIEFPPK
jgi:hypothetical protein